MNKDPLIYAVNSVRVELAARVSVIQELRRVGGPAQSRQPLDKVMSLWALVVLPLSTILSNEVQVDRTDPFPMESGGEREMYFTGLNSLRSELAANEAAWCESVSATNFCTSLCVWWQITVICSAKYCASVKIS